MHGGPLDASGLLCESRLGFLTDRAHTLTSYNLKKAVLAYMKVDTSAPPAAS